MIGRLLWGGLVAAVLVFLTLPLALVVLFSFNESALTSLPLTGLTLDWYRRLLADTSFAPALVNSLVVGVAAAAAALLTGTAAALGIARVPRHVGQRWVAVLATPMMLPALVLGIALASFFVRLLGWRLGLPTVILGHLAIVQPVVVVLVHARLAELDPALAEAARDLGASAWGAFRDITLPLVRPTLIGAALIAFAISLDDLVITFFTLAGGNTLATLVWGMIRTTLDPTINAIATLILLACTATTGVALAIARRG